MHFFSLASLAAVAATAAAAPTATDPKAILAQTQQTYTQNTLQQLKQSPQPWCNAQNVAVRKAYGALTPAERASYLKAVKCLAARPGRTDRTQVPGARNRRDDFVYAHINQTDFIHESGLLLPWHRQFVWAYEQALRGECGYRGPTPYWDWETTADDQTRSAIFDGSATSFGGNGKYVPHAAANASMIGLPVTFDIVRPAGTGGGCVTDGGLLPYTVNLGPVAPAHNAPNNTYGTQYNPRCLSRDFLPALSAANLSYAAVAQALVQPTIHTFRPIVEIRMHPNAHSFAGADLFDLFSSPNDPVFFLLHAQIDRLWALWQGQDYAARLDGLDGTDTFFNLPPSPNTTLSTVLKMGLAGGDIPVDRVMSTLKDRFCYMYA